MCVKKAGVKGVTISGMRKGTIYLPYRIMRQLGRKQKIWHYKQGINVVTFKTTKCFLEEQRKKGITMKEVHIEPKEPYVDDAYRKWLHEDIAERNKAKKKRALEEGRKKALDEIRKKMKKPPLYSHPTPSMP